MVFKLILTIIDHNRLTRTLDQELSKPKVCHIHTQTATTITPTIPNLHVAILLLCRFATITHIKESYTPIGNTVVGKIVKLIFPTTLPITYTYMWQYYCCVGI